MFDRFPPRKPAAASLIVLSLGWGCAMRGGPGLSFAEPPAVGDAWRQVRTLDRDSPVIATLRSGKRVRGRLVSIGEDEITVAGGDAQAVTVSRSQIQTLHLEQSNNSAKKGLLIGAGIGAGAGAGIGVGMSESIDVTTGITVPIFMGVGAATGALTGYLLGTGRSRKVLIYEAP